MNEPDPRPLHITLYVWWQRLGLSQKPVIPEPREAHKDRIQIKVINKQQMQNQLHCKQTHIFAYIVQPIKELVTHTLLKKYKQFTALFSKTKGPKALPKHQP